MIRNDALMMNQWMLSSGRGQGGWGLVSGDGLRPSYYVYQMYRKFGSQRVYTSSDDPNVTVYAARRDDGALTIMVINLASEPVEKALMLDNVEPGEAVETWLFDAEHNAEQVDDTALPEGATLQLPAESMLLLVVPAP